MANFGSYHSPPRPALQSDFDIEENARRSRSFVINGLRELLSESEDEKRLEDWKAACDICNYLRVPNPTIEGCKRMGAPRGYRSRPLMVELRSHDDVDTVLERAIFLSVISDTRHLELVRARSRGVERNRMQRTARPRPVFRVQITDRSGPRYSGVFYP